MRIIKRLTPTAILLGTTTVQGTSIALTHILGGVITNYYTIGVAMQVGSPMLMLLYFRALPTEKQQKTLILFYSIGLLIGIVLVNFGIFHRYDPMRTPRWG